MDIEDAIDELSSGKPTRFKRLLTICQTFFGSARIRGSHHIFKTPWPGDPRINVQASGKDAKNYQVKQVIQALEKLDEMDDEEDDEENDNGS
tara:strand:- start:895 stop:1170 length:276 start_codon:yes stop_codon:yes gene_type:complete